MGICQNWVIGDQKWERDLFSPAYLSPHCLFEQLNWSNLKAEIGDPHKCTMISSSIQKSSSFDFQLNTPTFSKIININFNSTYSSTMNKCYLWLKFSSKEDKHSNLCINAPQIYWGLLQYFVSTILEMDAGEKVNNITCDSGPSWNYLNYVLEVF